MKTYFTGELRLPRMRTRASTALGGVSALALLALLGAPERASAQASPSGAITPAIHDTVDKNGVDLLSGIYHPPQQSVSIGVMGQGGMTQAFYTPGRDNMTGFLSVAGDRAEVSIGEKMEVFIGYVSQQESGSTLDFTTDGQTFIYTDSGGTVATFAKNRTVAGVTTARIVSLQRPNGEVLTYHYKLFRTPTDAFDGERVQSITNNLGYQIKYEYSTAPDGQLSVTAVRGVNNAELYCDPEADSCGDLSGWPSLTFAGGGAGSTATVTDSLGRTTTQSGLGTGTVTTSYPGGRQITVAAPVNTALNTTLTLTSVEGTWTYETTRNNSNAEQTVTTKITDPLNQVSFAYGRRDLGVITKYTNERNLSTDYTYDDAGRLKRVQLPSGVATEYDYDDRGNVVVQRSIPRSGAQEPVSTQTAQYGPTCAGHEKTCNQPLWTKDARGNQTDYVYDEASGGRLSVTSPPDTNGVRHVMHIDYLQHNAQVRNAGGALVAVSTPVYLLNNAYACKGADPCADSERSVVFTGYENANLAPTRRVSYRGDGAEGATTLFSYDGYGNLTSQDGPLPGTGDTTIYRFDLGRRLIGVIRPDPDGAGPAIRHATKMVYAPNGRVASMQEGTVTGTSETEWQAFSVLDLLGSGFDSAGRKNTDFRQRPGENPASLTQYDYDGLGRIKCETVRMNPATFTSGQPEACTAGPEGSFGPDRITRYDYDPTGSVSAINQAVGTTSERQLRAYTYNADQLVETERDGKGNLTTYGYDGLNRLGRVSYPDRANGAVNSATDAHQFAFDADGRITGEALRDGTGVGNSYDALGRLLTRGVDGASFTYDTFGRVITASVSGATTTNAYDSRGNLLSQTGPLGTVSYQYDEADRRTRMTWPDGYFVTYAYDIAGQLQTINENGGQAIVNFGYDGEGRRTVLGRANSFSTTYAYGNDGLLAELDHNSPIGQPGDAITLQRNPAGQIFNRPNTNPQFASRQPEAGAPYEVNGLNQYTQAGSNAPQYDGRGNLTNLAGVAYTFDAANRLTASSTGATLSYDAGSRLISTGSTRFLYDGVDLIAEFDSAGANILKRYVHGPNVDEPLVTYDGAGVLQRHWLFADERGSVVAQANPAAQIDQATTFNDYGGGGVIGRFGFTGQAWLSEAGLYNFKARVYAPKLGRFMQADPAADLASSNLYEYVANDPVNSKDPTGLENPFAGSRISIPTTNLPGVTVTGHRPDAIIPTVPAETLFVIASAGGTNAIVDRSLAPAGDEVGRPCPAAFTIHGDSKGDNPEPGGRNGSRYNSTLPGGYDSAWRVLGGLHMLAGDTGFVYGPTVGRPDVLIRSLPSNIQLRVGSDLKPRVDIPANKFGPTGLSLPEDIHFTGGKGNMCPRP